MLLRGLGAPPPPLARKPLPHSIRPKDAPIRPVLFKMNSLYPLLYQNPCALVWPDLNLVFRIRKNGERVFDRALL